MAEAGHNSELTPAQRSALRMHHVRKLLDVEEDMQPLRDLKKKIRAEAKGDGFKLSEIDAAMRLMTMEDQSIFVAEIKELIDIAQAFNALPPGEQGSLFPDRRPADEKAFDAGKQAGLKARTVSRLPASIRPSGLRVGTKASASCGMSSRPRWRSATPH